jgi:hypothetical protein
MLLAIVVAALAEIPAGVGVAFGSGVGDGVGVGVGVGIMSDTTDGLMNVLSSRRYQLFAVSAMTLRAVPADAVRTFP